MRRLLFWLIASFVSSSASAQLVDPAAWSWFELSNFFNENEIAKEGIEAIHIKIDEKKDGEIIREKGDFLHYEFNPQGKLVESLKSVKLANRVDTLRNVYHLNKLDQLMEKEEVHPPFHFSFHYQYQKNRAIKEIKIDENSAEKDTVQQHFFSYKEQENAVLKEISYANGLAFKKEQTLLGSDGRIESHKLSYHRGGAYRHTTYYYENEHLKKVRLISHFSAKSERFKQFFYEAGRLHEVLHFEEGKRIKKMALTYKKNGLIEALIERDFRAKKIKIYYFMYQFRG